MMATKYCLFNSVIIGQPDHLSENYENVLNLLKYTDHNWLICCDLKVVALLLGVQEGYTK